MNGQLSMLDILTPTKEFCFDSDVNQIVQMLDDICMTNEAITEVKQEWSIWSHVPRYGYRLSYTLTLNKRLTENFLMQINKIVEYAKRRSIEISPCLHYGVDGVGALYIYSMFLDGRKRIK